MIAKQFRAMKRERRALVLAAIIVLQALCAMFFIADVILDISMGGSLLETHLFLETVATVGLTAGVIYLMRELRDLLNRMSAMELGIRAARGEMATLIDSFFDQWQLTPSEREIALLVLKGIDNDAIATMRGTANGTVRAQCASIYAKADVDGRAQLMSIFMEELIHAGDEQTGYRGAA